MQRASNLQLKVKVALKLQTQELFGSSIKSWRSKILKYPPTCKSRKPESKSQVSSKDEQADIKQKALRNSMTTFHKSVERYRNQTCPRTRSDFEETLWENAEKTMEVYRFLMILFPFKEEQQKNPICKELQTCSSRSLRL
ncbi:hypothetical protein TNCV_1549891 [Trichonephila clavipes]|nr:hypothetical protein TNCV_1549891 [Trichonephila clavipes]